MKSLLATLILSIFTLAAQAACEPKDALAFAAKVDAPSGATLVVWFCSDKSRVRFAAPKEWKAVTPINKAEAARLYTLYGYSRDPGFMVKEVSEFAAMLD